MHIGQKLFVFIYGVLFPKIRCYHYHIFIFPQEKIITSLYRFGLVANLSLYDIDT